MIRQDLLNEQLNWYEERGYKLKPLKFNKDHFYNLFKRYKYYGAYEHSFCCYGEEHSCWCEVIEEGVWDWTLKNVRELILNSMQYFKHYIRNKQCGNRYYMYKDNDKCFIYIYCRDTEIQTDYHIWFNNNEED